MRGGPAFLLGPNFYAVRSYNPSMNYALAICHLGDCILGAGPFHQPFPGSERALTLAEIQEVQSRLTHDISGMQSVVTSTATSLASNARKYPSRPPVNRTSDAVVRMPASVKSLILYSHFHLPVWGSKATSEYVTGARRYPDERARAGRPAPDP